MKLWKTELCEGTAEKELASHASYANKFYRSYLGFYTQYDHQDYDNELNDWELWLEIVAELLGRFIGPACFIRTVVSAGEYFRKPSQLIDDDTIRLYEEQLEKTRQSDVACFANAIQTVKLETEVFNRECFEGSGYTDNQMMAATLYGAGSSIYINQDLSLEKYIVAHSLGIQDLACTELMFIRAAMRYCLGQAVFHEHSGVSRFLELFEPEAKKVYLLLTDASKIDFQKVVNDLSQIPRQHP